MRVLIARNMASFASASTGVEKLALVPEVQYALDAWRAAFKDSHVPGVLIGGLALSMYVKPRSTSDVDLLFLQESDIPATVTGFRRTRRGAFEETHHQVEIELVTPGFVNVKPALFREVVDTAIKHSELRVASLEALVCLKIVAALNSKKRARQDLADAVALLRAKEKAGGFHQFTEHMSDLEVAKLDELITEVAEE